jgi:hypothetical protein
MFLTLNLVMLKDFLIKNKIRREKNKNKKHIRASGARRAEGTTQPV